MKFTSDKKKALIADAINDVLNPEKLQDKDTLNMILYRCLDMTYKDRGEDALEDILKMWDNISNNYSKK